jgi:hypothetical protein
MSRPTGKRCTASSWQCQTHTARVTQERIQELQWWLLEHLPYSPDLDPSDFHLFGPLKKPTLVANVSLKTKGLKRRCGSGWQQTKDFCAANFYIVVKWLEKRINVGGAYFEKKNVFPMFKYHMFYVLYPFMTYLLSAPRTRHSLFNHLIYLL